MARLTIADMRPEQLEMFARGLSYLAKLDGETESETALVHKLLAATGRPELLGMLDAAPFDAAVAATVFDTEDMRRGFLRAAIAMLRADGDLSDAELDALSAISKAFGLKPQLIGLLGESPGAAII